MLLSGLGHLFFPDETEKRMSRSRNVRIAGAILLALILPAIVWGFYVVAVLLAIFGLPRLFAPDRSIRLQQRLYSRRVHGDRKSTRLNSSHGYISYAVFCLKKK